MQKLKYMIHTESITLIALAAALVSSLFVPVSSAYWAYIDFQVLVLLFCLMVVVAGLKKTGVFEVLAYHAAIGAKHSKALYVSLILSCFFSAMLITNDVALITFVPFAILVLSLTGHTDKLIIVIVLQTVAANLGSMLTPIGNPQNLYLYSFYGINPFEFFYITFPITVLGLFLIVLFCISFKKEAVALQLEHTAEQMNNKAILLYIGLFTLCLAAVFRLLDYKIVFLIVLVVITLADRTVLRKVDYGLLITFVCFFIFAGNIQHIQPVKTVLQLLLGQQELAVAVVSSQVVSNVPAAVLLSGFTNDYRALLLGTNIGGLGTIVASLASLISFKLYLKTPNANAVRYLGIFTAVNGIMLFILCVFAVFAVS